MSENLLGQAGQTATVEGAVKTLKELLGQERIAVHSGPFHADDVVSIALLRVLGFKGEIVRTRDKEILKSVVGIDVSDSRCGGQFDHHGPAAAPDTCALTKLWSFVRTSLDAVAASRFESLMGQDFASVAAIDSGSCRNPAERPNMFGWVHLLNDASDASFFKAVEMAETILKAALTQAEEWASTLAEAKEAMEAAAGGIPVLKTFRQGMKEALWTLGCLSKFFVSPHGETEWGVIQCCPVGGTFNPFGFQQYLPKSWAGLRGEALQAASGYASAIFAFAPAPKFEVVMAYFGSLEDAVNCAETCSK